VTGLSDAELSALATCIDCNGSRAVPDIFGDYVLCHACTVLPREPGWTANEGPSTPDP
jgi:hypothetical protein